MLVACGIRLHGVNQSLVTFHPTRHYDPGHRRAAITTRRRHAGWERDLARAARAMQPTGEPPFMEWWPAPAIERLAMKNPHSAGPGDDLLDLGAIPLYRLASRLCSAPSPSSRPPSNCSSPMHRRDRSFSGRPMTCAHAGSARRGVGVLRVAGGWRLVAAALLVGWPRWSSR